MGIHILYLNPIEKTETDSLIKTLNMKYLTTIGRILFALPFGILGLNHFLMKSYYLGMISTFIPGGGYTIIITGLALIAACISIMAKKYIQLSCLLLALLLFIFILTIHVPGLFNTTEITVLSMQTKVSTLAFIELLKDTALMGGALMIAGIYREEKAAVKA
jgi:putative oxidoreductase